MKRLRIPTLILAILASLGPAVQAHAEWFQGGSLHDRSVAEWNQASYANRLATSADWALASKNVEALVRKSGTIDTLKPFAEQLLACIDRIAGADDVIDETHAIRVASACMAYMEW